ncbi:glutathione S-transferase family protein [Azospirillum picis]|uniref:GST-like protein n=1 Tax=Azospirillum picis TaxID=488438 RepID=A0ABU0MVJ4_9PROT|nr:glutathione S-transferase family protein [Azospirillum picis]MBP2303600.1 GST-like protein [Azospirillum picis]MDQ0537441.1 GST-like protein [Azospirillum picis]
MFELYAFATPNSVKSPIALEEMGLSYVLKPVNIRQGEQKAPDFLALNPNAKVPVLVDGALVLTESAAILVHLAEKTGRPLPRDGADRARVFEQLFFHASALSPAFGNAGFFKRRATDPQPLAQARFVAGDDFTIADIAHFGWLWRREFPGLTLDGRSNLVRWFDAVAARPAVRRAIARVEALLQAA